MAKRGERFAEPKLTQLMGSGILGSLATWAERHLEWQRVKNFSPHTLDKRERYLAFFIAWCEARSVLYPQEVTKPILERYQRHLFHLRLSNGKALSFGAQTSRITPPRLLFRWLTRQNVLLYNPASELELPELEHRLPRAVLTLREAETVLNVPEVRTTLGLRDRAILELFYSTGMRRAELMNLLVTDVDTERGTAIIRQGKGKKDRVVPVGERACDWVRKYLYEARPELCCGIDEGVLFLTNSGESFTPSRVTNLVRGYVKAAKLGKMGSCHLFRHTAATLMLEGGADIRYIQALLGHACISTTEIYAQVSIKRLQQVHRATHPGATNARQERELDEEEQEAEEAKHAALHSLLAADSEDEGFELDDSEHDPSGGGDMKRHVVLTLEVTEEQLAALRVLNEGGDARNTLMELVGRVMDGVTRPGAWERPCLEQAFGDAWHEHLEPDPDAPWRQRPSGSRARPK